MKSYTKKQILDMLDQGRIDTAQASKMLLDLDVTAMSQDKKKEPEQADPMARVASELRAMADRIDKAISGATATQSKTNAALAELAANLLKSAKTLRVEMPKGDARPKKLVATPTRDHRGLAERWVIEVVA